MIFYEPYKRNTFKDLKEKDIFALSVDEQNIFVKILPFKPLKKNILFKSFLSKDKKVNALNLIDGFFYYINDDQFISPIYSKTCNKSKIYKLNECISKEIFSWDNLRIADMFLIDNEEKYQITQNTYWDSAFEKIIKKFCIKTSFHEYYSLDKQCIVKYNDKEIEQLTKIEFFLYCYH